MRRWAAALAAAKMRAVPPFHNLRLDRRTFLRGTAACMALPWLEAMVPARPSAPPALPRRCLFVFAPNGQKMDDWTPAQAGTDFELPHTLQPLQPLRSSLTVLSGLALDGGRPHGDGVGDHARAAASFLTCAHPRKTGGADIEVGVSIDQLIAAAVGGATAFPSLELGIERGAAAGICDSGYSCAYSNNIAWKNKSTPVAKEADPRQVFARLFGDAQRAADGAELQRQQRQQRSVLDAVQQDAKALLGKVSPADRRKLDDYFTAVRELEQRLARPDDEAPATAVAVPDGLLDRWRDPRTHLALMYELLALAFATDRTRIATLMLGNAGSNRSYRFLDVPEGHHELSHHGRRPEKLAAIRKINRFHVEQFAAFGSRLQAQPEGDADLLRQSLIVYASAIGDGDRHNHDDLPVVLLGNGGGKVRGGRHLVSPRDTPMANLYVSIAAAMSAPQPGFADSTGPLPL